MQEEWLNEQVHHLFVESRDYKQKALLLAIKELMSEQKKRTEQLKGRLDGELWAPNKWK